MSQQLARIEEQLAQGNLAGACALAEQVVQQGSQVLAIHLQLAGIYIKLGRYRDAGKVVLGARHLVAASPKELIELAQRLMYFNESEALSGLARRQLARPLGNAAAEADLSAMVSMMGDQSTALPLLERTIAAMGSAPMWLYNRSQMHLYSGRFAEAERDLRACLRTVPGMAKAHWALSKLPSVDSTSAEADVRYLHGLSGKLPVNSQDEVFRQFALFNRLDRLGHVEQAWAALAEGCRIKRRLVAYDANKTRAYFEALKAVPLSTTVHSNLSNLEHDQAQCSGIVPVFIVGMHRSGTTLLERILGNHPEVAEAGELYDFPAQLRWAIGRHFSGSSDSSILDHLDRIDFSGVGRRYLDHIAWRAGERRYLVDKLPSNFINVAYIAMALPQAKIIHIHRDAMDTCFSNLKELFSNACAYSYDQDELADYYQMYSELMAHWRHVLPNFVLDVSYEALTDDPMREAKRIFNFCGLDWRPECVDVANNARAVNTASSAQVREPIHKRNIEAWKRYEPQLQRLQSVLDHRAH